MDKIRTSLCILLSLAPGKPGYNRVKYGDKGYASSNRVYRRSPFPPRLLCRQSGYTDRLPQPGADTSRLARFLKDVPLVKRKPSALKITNAAPKNPRLGRGGGTGRAVLGPGFQYERIDDRGNPRVFRGAQRSRGGDRRIGAGRVGHALQRPVGGIPCAPGTHLRLKRLVRFTPAGFPVRYGVPVGEEVSRPPFGPAPADPRWPAGGV